MRGFANCHSISLILPIFAGPDLPISLYKHSMVNLGLGQAVLGGYNDNVIMNKIYHVTCSQQICKISKLSQELKVPRQSFVAIPVPDSLSGCSSESKFVTNFL